MPTPSLIPSQEQAASLFESFAINPIPRQRDSLCAKVVTGPQADKSARFPQCMHVVGIQKLTTALINSWRELLVTDREDNKQPSFEVFSVKEGSKDRSFFNRIGTAFRHKDGEGHTISLNALPVNDKIVLRTPKDRLNDMRSSEPPARRKHNDRDR